MTDDATVVMPYSGVYMHVVATVLQDVAPGVPDNQRGAVSRSILDGLRAAGMLADSPAVAGVTMWRNRAIAAEQQRDKAMSQAAIREHTRSWVHVKTQLELDEALRVVRRAEAWRGALPPDDPDEHARLHNALVAAVDEWLEFQYDAEAADSEPAAEDQPTFVNGNEQVDRLANDPLVTDAEPEPEPAVES